GLPARQMGSKRQVRHCICPAATGCMAARRSHPEISNFAEISCDKPHRFEVAAREDLSTYPTSEFGPDAERPDVTRQNALRDELCESSTLGYLHGKWDPNGKYDIASVLPPQAAWQQGDRTL
ncbi:septum formation family protein, partial [Bacteroides fragilis]|nr:septum formation family protein [Bacteroides fragilis]